MGLEPFLLVSLSGSCREPLVLWTPLFVGMLKSDLHQNLPEEINDRLPCSSSRGAPYGVLPRR